VLIVISVLILRKIISIVRTSTPFFVFFVIKTCNNCSKDVITILISLIKGNIRCTVLILYFRWWMIILLILSGAVLESICFFTFYLLSLYDFFTDLVWINKFIHLDLDIRSRRRLQSLFVLWLFLFINWIEILFSFLIMMALILVTLITIFLSLVIINSILLYAHINTMIFIILWIIFIFIFIRLTNIVFNLQICYDVFFLFQIFLHLLISIFLKLFI
jgi:hypothetical protein